MIIKDSAITDFNGATLLNPDGSEARIVPCIVQSLLTLQGAPVASEESLKRYMLAKKVHEGQSITSDQAETIKSAACTIFNPLTYGRIVDAINQAAEEAGEKASGGHRRRKAV